ncbi:hypothetical protein NADFUDRAFT_67409 [Nadsonia fulvescens var. elongata DSM 6958]|uniref:Metacaspase-1 n=1 Tax=Nadsonia fulvescens var. elongata DSM 6958 TaxID=857566 RepID=A0A1E3PFR9_9ASCO|nr:hypothetical protein NADFUDRAFT_67409 [Nadsonia fulvescens var. elongata DSM 6958]
MSYNYQGNGVYNNFQNQYSGYGNYDAPPPPMMNNYNSPNQLQGPPNGYYSTPVGFGNNNPQLYLPPCPPSNFYSDTYKGYNNADRNYNYQQRNGMRDNMNSFGNTQGRRKALLIGINYTGSANALRGCINDVQNISNFLKQCYGYSPDDMVILTDDQANPRSQPTKANILSAMQWLVANARPNDSLFFHFSGHGGQTKDYDGDEDDGYDETIYPVDFRTAGQIVDDQMHDIMVRSLPPGCRLTALFDSCHSGTVLDLQFAYSTKGVLKENSKLKGTGMGLMSAVSSYSSGDIGGVLSSLTGVVKQTVGPGGGVRQSKVSTSDVISISGCKDSQTSADAYEAGTATGAMSYAFISVLSNQREQSYLSLLQNMRNALYGKYSQKPQLSASHPIDVNSRFIM